VHKLSTCRYFRLGISVSCNYLLVTSTFSLHEIIVGYFSLLAGVKAGRVHLCRVAGNTVWSHMASDVP